MGYFASVVNVVSSNSCVGHSSRIKISFSLLLTCTDELISGPKIMKFFSMLPLGNKNSERPSNSMVQPLSLYLSSSAFLATFTDLNKQLTDVKSVFKFLNCDFSV